ncbi:golgin subfamily A member 3 [Patella vulgata]|uniref:golgin subfamily A member 3 n=1 Tax=Patella vulgata TaxID=6465 RepID=UPI0024A9A41D|nr:golgin subfamily A member 3 [Patella vulgata]
MEPFKLTLQQVTFKEGEENPNQLFDSFDAVINCNYDSKRSDEKEPATNIYRNDYQNVKYTTCSLDFTTQAVGIQVPSRSGVVKTSRTDWYNYTGASPSTSLDDFVINADVNFTSQAKHEPIVTDISTIAKISSNSLAANQHIPFTKKKRKIRTFLTTSLKTTMPTEMETNTDQQGLVHTPVLDSSFDTVAEALHLQRTVIGNSNITPAPPDVVAQIVAEAERKLRLESESNGSVSSLSETSSLHSEQMMSPNTDSGTPKQPDQPPFFPSGAISKNPPRLEIDTSSVDLDKSYDSISPRELIRIPAHDLSVTKEKSGSKEKTEKEKQNVKPKDSSGGQINKNIHDKITKKKSREKLVEQYQVTDTQTFLQSLPPVKNVDLAEFQSPEKISDDIVQNAPQREDSGIGLDKPYTSTPNGKESSKTEFVLPPLGPLFTNIPKPSFTFTKMPRPAPHISTDENSKVIRNQLDTVLRDKARLEGQLEVLTQESNTNLQERAELQAQLASLKLKLLSKIKPENDDKKAALKADLEMLRQSRQQLEDSMAETQRQLDEKAQESKILQTELQVTQDAMDKLHIRMKELRDTLSAKEMTIQALKNKIAELYVEVQNTLQAKSEADADAEISKSDLTALINAKEWYQQQLQLAHEVRCSLQKELTIIQAQSVSQCSIVERLKMDNTKLRQQLTESQQRALKEKELLAKHLEAIQTDMMDREAAFREMQGEKNLIEDSFNSQCKTVEDEHSRLAYLMQATVDLESQLERAQGDAKKKQIHILNLENKQIDLEKKLTLSQEKINEKDGLVEELNQKMIEVETQLKAFQNGIFAKDTEILKLKEEKATAEIALNGALKEKAAVDNALDVLKSNLGKVQTSFKQMRQDLSKKVNELETVKTEKNEYHVELEKAKKELEIKRRSYDTIHQDYDVKASALNEIQVQKSMLESQIQELKKQISDIVETGERRSADQKAKEVQLQEELQETKSRLVVVQQQLQEELNRKEDAHLVQHIDTKSVQEEALITSNDMQDKEVQVAEEKPQNAANIEVLAQEQQTDLTHTRVTEMEEATTNTNVQEISVNTVKIEQKDVDMQTVDVRESKPDQIESSVNTETVQLVDSKIQTTNEPNVVCEDVSVNTDLLQQKHIQSQTTELEKCPSVDCSVQATVEMSVSEVNGAENNLLTETFTQTIESTYSDFEPKPTLEHVSVNTEAPELKDIQSQTTEVKKQLSVDSSVQTSIEATSSSSDTLEKPPATEAFTQTLEETKKEETVVEDVSVNTEMIKQIDNQSQTTHIHVEKQASVESSVQTSVTGSDGVIELSSCEFSTQSTDESAGDLKIPKIISTDTSMNTDKMEQKDIYSQTIVVESADSSIQTSNETAASELDVIKRHPNTETATQTVQIQVEPQTKIICEDASINTERLVQTDMESQTSTIQKCLTVEASAQTFVSNADSATTEKQQSTESFTQTSIENKPDVKTVSQKTQETATFIDTTEAANQTDIPDVVMDVQLKDSSVTELSDKTDGGSIYNQLSSQLPKVDQRTSSLSVQQSTVDLTVEQRLQGVNEQKTFIIEGVSNDKYEELLTQNANLNSKMVNLEDNLAFHRTEAKEIISKLNDNLLAVQNELTDRQTTFNENVEALSTKLHETLAEKQQLERELVETQEKYKQSTTENQQKFRNQILSIESELNAAQVKIKELENYLLALQESKNAEIIELQQQLATVVEELDLSKQEQTEAIKTEELNKQLALDLEKERGRLEGLIQNNTSLKQHVGQLEEALARRESSLVELQAHLLDSNKDKDMSTEDYLKRVQTLEMSLQKEKNSQRDLRKQIGVKITENKKLKKHQEEFKREQELLKQQVELHEQEVEKLQTELDNNRDSSVAHKAEVQSLQSEKKSLQLELEHIQRELADNLARNPLIHEQMESLEWQISQKNKEVEFAHEQVKSVEKRQQTEIDLLRQTIKDKQLEIEELQKELSSAKKEKTDQKSRVTELRSALKSSVQYHKLTKKLNSKKDKLKSIDSGMEEKDDNECIEECKENGLMLDKGIQVNVEDTMVLPEPNYDFDAIETLLEQTAIRTLESRPLDNLQSCLISLKSQINGLQMSMEVHTTNIHSSNQTASDIEKEVHELQQVVKTVANTTFASLTTETASISTEGAQEE